MLLRLFLLMTVLPPLELWLLIRIGEWMGAVETVCFTVLMGVVGATLAKREGLGLWAQLREDAARGIPPADRLVEGLLVLVGGLLLITPGVLTDIAGIAFLVPFTRRLLVPPTRRWLASKLPGAGSVGGVKMRVGPLQHGPAARAAAERFDHPTA
jgi:UPF0716 protein FxsA